MTVLHAADEITVGLRSRIMARNEGVGDWRYLHDEVLLQIFCHLNHNDLACRAGLVCKHWHVVSKDEYLWRDLVARKSFCALKFVSLLLP